MTLEELLTLLGLLGWLRTTESCADNMAEKEVDQMIEVVKREIDKLKQ